jgi:4-hydroxy-4-methyl-2-oxoglutarate aldolase
MPDESSRVFRDIPRVRAEQLADLRGLAMADVHDALPPAVRSAGLLHAGIRPLTPGLRACGQAVTAYCAPGDSLMSHCAAYLAQPGDVLVITNGGVAYGALWGGHMAFDAKTFGLAGTVADAPIRDSASLREIEYPVWARGVSVSRTEKRGLGCVNMPIACGGASVNPGDIVVADDDGVLVFAPMFIDSIVKKVRHKSHEDAAIRRRVAGGERLFDTQGFRLLLEQNGVAIHDGTWHANGVRR